MSCLNAGTLPDGWARLRRMVPGVCALGSAAISEWRCAPHLDLSASTSKGGWCPMGRGCVPFGRHASCVVVTYDRPTIARSSALLSHNPNGARHYPLGTTHLREPPHTQPTPSRCQTELVNVEVDVTDRSQRRIERQRLHHLYGSNERRVLHQGTQSPYDFDPREVRTQAASQSKSDHIAWVAHPRELCAHLWITFKSC